jgi:hypothetical protein
MRADRGFSTLRATVRDWERYGRIAELQGLVGAGEGEAGEVDRLTRLFVGARGEVREEWDTGRVVLAHSGDLTDDASHWPLLVTDWLYARPPLRVVGEREVGGRRGIAVESRGENGPASMLLPGANRCIGVFDHERAILLRCEAWLDDELLMVEELIEVAFDEPLDPQIFKRS